VVFDDDDVVLLLMWFRKFTTKSTFVFIEVVNLLLPQQLLCVSQTSLVKTLHTFNIHYEAHHCDSDGRGFGRCRGFLDHADLFQGCVPEIIFLIWASIDETSRG
jgi:hypothetical protein